MNVEIICVGTELLLGDIVNTNASYLSQQCARLGFNSYYQSVVGDNKERLSQLIETAMQRSDILIFSGGLGPTYDDITKETVSEVVQEPLVFDSEAFRQIEAHFANRKSIMTENNRKQAFVFKNGCVLYNTRGTAPGLYLEKNNRIIVLLPGPPRELETMFELSVRPLLQKKQGDTIVSHSIYLTGIGESALETEIKELMLESTNPTIAPYAKSDGVMLRITAKSHDEAHAESLITPVLNQLLTQFESYVFSVDQPEIEHVVSTLISKQGINVDVIDSVTQGLLVYRLNKAKQGVVTGRIVKHVSEDMKDVPNTTLKIVLESVPTHENTVSVALYYNGAVRSDMYSLSRSFDHDYEGAAQRVSTFALKAIFDMLRNI